MDALDLVCPVREGAVNEQLRYALRSWSENVPHRRVWLVGGLPPWATGVGRIPVHQDGTKYRNTTAAVEAACLHPEVSDPFLYCNDDFFVLRRLGAMPVYHRGPVAEVEAYYATRGDGAYLRGLRETRNLLAELGHPVPLSYELHVPLPVGKAGMLAALEVGRHLEVLHKRTAYGNLAGIGGEQMQDVKILHRAPRYDTSSGFLSTMPDSFTHGAVGAFLRQAFFRPSPYERSRR
jgi:hypothetical protein